MGDGKWEVGSGNSFLFLFMYVSVSASVGVGVLRYSNIAMLQYPVAIL